MTSPRAVAWASVLALVSIAIVAASALQLAADDTAAVIVVAAVYAIVGLTVFVLPRGGVAQGGMGPQLAALVLVGPHSAMVGVGIGAVFAGLANRDRAHEDVSVAEAARQPIALVSAWLVADTLGLLSGLSGSEGAFLQVFYLLALGVLFVVVEIVSFALVEYLTLGTHPIRSILNLGRMLTSAYLGQASVAAVLVLVYPTLGVLGVLVLAALMLLMKHSFSLYLRTHTAYSKTVGVLARLAEFERREIRGHSERVADLSAQVGRALGYSYAELERLSMAALLHDIGMVKPTSGALASTDSYAAVGARIVSQIERLAACAPIIEAHPRDYESMSTSRDNSMSQIIRAVSDYDRASLGITKDSESNEDIIERMRQQCGKKYSPEAIDALAAVVGARQ